MSLVAPVFAAAPEQGESFNAEVNAEANAEVDAKVDAARAELIARRFEANATVLTIFDRAGKVVTTVGERGIYGDPVFSPDRTRLAVGKSDLTEETGDIWVFDLASGEGIPITSNENWHTEWAGSPIWSPDGRELAYVAMRAGYEGIYRKSSTGEGSEELLYQHPGANLWIGDWSVDGAWLSFSVSDLYGGTLYALSMTGAGTRPPIELFKIDKELRAGPFSPDVRFLSYISEEPGIVGGDVVIVPFDAGSGSAATSSKPDVRPGNAISDQGSKTVMRSGWRADGGELYYVGANSGVMAAEFHAGASLKPTKLTELFHLSQAIRIDAGRINVSRDGERFVITVPHAPKLEQVTVFDRQGQVLQRLGEPGIYRNPALSPDGKRVAVMRIVPETGNADIWTFDLRSGAGTPLTTNSGHENWPVWSPDGTQLAYRVQRGLFASIYLKEVNGTGGEQHIYQYTPGAGLQLTDWSQDGRFLAFQDGCWGVLYVVPLGEGSSAAERRAIDWLRDEYQVAQIHFSPDSRFAAYLTDEVAPDEFRAYIAPFDASHPEAARPTAPVELPIGTVEGLLGWREDGKELYYLTPKWEVMSVSVDSTPAIQTGTPELLFSLPGPLPGTPKQWKSVSPDGRRFVFVLTVPVSVR